MRSLETAPPLRARPFPVRNLNRMAEDYQDPWKDAHAASSAQSSTGTNPAAISDLASLSLDGHEPQSNPSEQNVWDLSQAEWASDPKEAESEHPDTAPSDVSADVDRHASPTPAQDLSEKPESTLVTPDAAPAVSSEQKPAQSEQPRSPPFSSPSKHRNSPSLPSLSLASIRSAFAGSTPPPPEIWTPASPSSAQVVAGPSSSTHQTFSGEERSPSPGKLAARQEDPPFDFKRFQQQMASVRVLYSIRPRQNQLTPPFLLESCCSFS